MDLAFPIIIAILLIFLVRYCKQRRVIWFYSHECIHCRRMHREWEAFENKAPFNIKTEKIDVDKYPDMALKFGIKSVPYVIKVSPTGHNYVYRGNRTAEDLLQFARS